MQDQATRGMRMVAVAAAVLGVLMATASVARGQQIGISLMPSVVELSGTSGQAHKQTLSLTNNTPFALEFEMVAEDVVIQNGERTFVAAGQRPDSIAATALFSPARIVIQPGTTGTVDVTVTIPDGTAVRALAAIFNGVTQVRVQGGIAMTGSLGTLMTFNLNDTPRLEASEIKVEPETATTNLSFSQELQNVGREPITPTGAIAVTNAEGLLVTRIPVERQRLLPGERATILAEYPGRLSPGRYQAFLTMAWGAQTLTRTASFVVTADSADAVPALRAGGQ